MSLHPTEWVSLGGMRPLALHAGVLFLLAALCLTACSRRDPPVEPVVEEVTASELESSPEGLRRVGTSQLFTGWLVAHYPHGEIQSRSAISNGLLEGPSEGWYTNGQIQVREFFSRGVSHGIRTKWYLSGAKLSEVPIVDGQLHGTFRRWHENGRVSEEIEMRENQPTGVARAFDLEGRVIREVEVGVTPDVPAESTLE